MTALVVSGTAGVDVKNNLALRSAGVASDNKKNGKHISNTTRCRTNDVIDLNPTIATCVVCEHGLGVFELFNGVDEHSQSTDMALSEMWRSDDSANIMMMIRVNS